MKISKLASALLLTVSSMTSFAQAPEQLPSPSIVLAFPEEILYNIFETNGFRERTLNEITKKYGQKANNIVIIVNGDFEWFPTVQQCVFTVSTILGTKNEKVDPDKIILSRSFSPVFHRTGIMQSNDPARCVPDIANAMQSVLMRAVEAIGTDPRKNKKTPDNQKPSVKGKEWT